MNIFIWKHYISIVLICLIILIILSSGALTQESNLQNPLNANNGADPWLTYYEGNYYLATTTWTSTWYIRKSQTLAGLKIAEPIEIYYETDPSRCCNFWAPEFYLLDSPNGKRWYFYYSAGTANTLDNQHTHVLESESTDPLWPLPLQSETFRCKPRRLGD